VAEDLPWGASDRRQLDVYEAFLKEASGQWTCLYRSWGDISSFSGGQYSALFPEARVERARGDFGWDLMVGSGAPGFSQMNTESGWETTYERRSDDVEPLVLYRSFNGLRPRELELSEEFRLLFNLWEDRKTKTYYLFGDAGDPIVVATITDDSVRVATSLLRRYQAARQLHLALFLDSTLWSESLKDEIEWETHDGDATLAYYRNVSLAGRPFSRLFGKRILTPPPIEACGFWPYEEEREYESFVIDVNDLGHEITHTSEPDKLANNFGKNPESPHYLTPVFFRREVLNKYYADPDRYSVEDGHIRCAGLWGLRVDNDAPDHVVVFLGDLGRDIPLSEARYWRSFNIVPQEHVSETLFRRAFLGEFADPTSVDLRFARAYAETNEVWEKAYGWLLFNPLHEDDAHLLAKLHVPVSDSQSEFDEQVLYLAKLLVDYLNEGAISKATATPVNGEKGLAKLERLLTETGAADAAALVRPLANVQGLRSRGAAHRKGATFDLTVAIGELSKREGVRKLMSESVDALESLKSHAGRGERSDSVS
jgi:hypothetical protein